MNRQFLMRQITALSLLLGLAAGSRAQETQYKEYAPVQDRKVLFILSYNDNTLSINLPVDSGYQSASFPRQGITIDKGVVFAERKPLFDGQGLLIHGQVIDYASISDLRISRDDKWMAITFYAMPTGAGSAARIRRGNRITFSDSIVIDKNDFVRGTIFSVTGNIDVLGEANKDVVSLFGNVTLEPLAVVRGDLATITGAVTVPRNASVYGAVYSGSGKGVGKRHRFFRHENELEVTGEFHYNRVDGATPYVGLKFQDQDSLLPSAWVSFGRAFASKRWRYEVGLEQTITRQRPLSVGGTYYRRLASGDDWLLSDNENLAFTLLAKEDFKDYYEAEGGTLYARFRPIPKLTLETSYRNEKTHWLEAHRNLWSLFGGDKRFGLNFGTVDSAYRVIGISEIDTSTNASLTFSADYDTRKTEEPFSASAWRLAGELEWSHKSFGSDFDYRRYTLDVVRYQRVTRYTMLLSRGMFGGSDGYLPMYKRFFLGGLGTLYGYKQKEYMGNRFWMINSEYRVQFPRTDLAFGVFYDIGQIANNHPLNGDVEVKSSLGAAIYLSSDFRLSIAKRLDRSYDDNPKTYVRFDRAF
ncbi:MAG TPA: BamA/TamA family outer membrane protein [Candidatus Acidoferrum sp.]|nr:BamA/TamA family outer membrane protein [Candidatus Acidoferrum sp.]